MERNDYLKMLVEEMHSTTMATIGADGHPQTRVIDMMLWDKKGVYFLTAKGKAFYAQLMEQGYVAISATKDKKQSLSAAESRTSTVKSWMKIFGKIHTCRKLSRRYTRALEVFRVYEAEGEYFDISDPSHIVRDTILIGGAEQSMAGYEVGNECIGCKLCFSVCPQKCIDITRIPAVIDQHQCLHCGRCAETCPRGTIRKRGQ